MGNSDVAISQFFGAYVVGADLEAGYFRRRFGVGDKYSSNTKTTKGDFKLNVREQRQKCIRSLRVARQLMGRGFLPMDVEKSRKSRGYLVFVFRDTPEFNAALNEIMGGNIE